MIHRVHGACLALTLVLGVTAGCATRAFLRPAGPAEPFPEATTIWADATRGCRGASSYRARLRVSGRLRGSRVPGVTAGLALDRERLAMSLIAGGAPEVSLAGSSSDMTVVMHRANRFARGAAADVIDALIGVRLTPAVLFAAVTGCVTPGGEVTAPDRIGDVARLHSPDGIVYLRRSGDRWQLAAGDVGDIRIDYRRLVDGWPRELTIRQGEAVTLTLQVAELELDPALPDGLFRARVPEATPQMSLDALRTEGPFAQTD
jgi:hypothetical protein